MMHRVVITGVGTVNPRRVKSATASSMLTSGVVTLGMTGYGSATLIFCPAT